MSHGCCFQHRARLNLYNDDKWFFCVSAVFSQAHRWRRSIVDLVGHTPFTLRCITEALQFTFEVFCDGLRAARGSHSPGFLRFQFADCLSTRPATEAIVEERAVVNRCRNKYPYMCKVCIRVRTSNSQLLCQRVYIYGSGHQRVCWSASCAAAPSAVHAEELSVLVLLLCSYVKALYSWYDGSLDDIAPNTWYSSFKRI